MEQAQSVVGIDVSKSDLDIALLTNGKTRAKTLDNTSAGHNPLQEWLSKAKVDLTTPHICMEAKSVYYEALALKLYEVGFKVSVVNPACIKGV